MNLLIYVDDDKAGKYLLPKLRKSPFPQSGLQWFPRLQNNVT